MQVDLDKKDLIALVKGKEPNYDVFDHPLVKQCGEYRGGMTDSWHWNKYVLEEISEAQLWELYQVCKNSWK